jgi:outer membrane protein assembly factor BamB
MPHLPRTSALIARLTVASILAATLPAVAQSTFHGDVARTGVYPADGPVPVGELKWSFTAGGAIVGSPAVVDGTVYFGALDGHLHAIDAASGTEKWKFKSRMPIACTPTVTGGTVYITSSAGSLAALDAATGAPKWVCPIEAERRFEARGLHGYPPATQTMPDAWDMFTSSPAVSDGLVFFGAGDGGIYAVDARSGAVRWTFQAGLDPAIHNQEGFQYSCAVADGVVYVGCRDAHVYALDAATGRRLWDYSTGKSWVIGTPAVRDGVVYAGTSDSARFFALDAKTGRLRFNADTKAYVFSSAALCGPRAYVGFHNGALYAFNARTGALDWSFRTEGSRRDPLKVLDAELRLDQAAFHPVTGDFGDMYVDFYRFTTVGGIMASPAVVDGVIYFGSLDGKLYALR